MSYLISENLDDSTWAIWAIEYDALHLVCQEVDDHTDYHNIIEYEDMETWTFRYHVELERFSVLTKEEADAYIFANKL
jgi:hypothetical protein